MSAFHVPFYVSRELNVSIITMMLSLLLNERLWLPIVIYSAMKRVDVIPTRFLGQNK